MAAYLQPYHNPTSMTAVLHYLTTKLRDVGP